MPWWGPKAVDEDSMVSSLCSEVHIPDDVIPSSLHHATARRFLVAREWDADRAAALLRAHVEWRQSNLLAWMADRESNCTLEGRFTVLRKGAEPLILVECAQLPLTATAWYHSQPPLWRVAGSAEQ